MNTKKRIWAVASPKAKRLLKKQARKRARKGNTTPINERLLR